MSTQELMDSCLRVISNRCRNLRKTIDRARTWEQAAQNGLVLNDEQTESIRGVPRKEAILLELQEILKKQTAIVESHREVTADPLAAPSMQPTLKSTGSARLNDDCKAEICKIPKSSVYGGPGTDSSESPLKPDGQHGNIVTEVSSSIDSDVQNPVPDATAAVLADPAVNRTGGLPPIANINSDSVEVHRTNAVALPSSSSASSKHAIEHSSGVISDNPPSPNEVAKVFHPAGALNAVTQSLAINSTNIDGDSSLADKYAKIIHDLEKRLSLQHAETKSNSIHHALNLFHVVDFLRQPGSREALLAYYTTADSRQQLRPLTSLDMDLLCYFNVMLTSPNGNVPHDEAVDVSTAHCLEFLNNSSAEAFKGTSYVTLSDIVRSIASCPILTDRGRPVSVHGKGRSRNTARSKVRNVGRPTRSGPEDGKATAPIR